MRLHCLKTKPPPTRWTAAATIGLAASLGSYTGTKLVDPQEGELVLYSISIATAVVGLLCTTRTIKTTMISVAVLLFFLCRSVGDGAEAPFPWAVTLDGELVELTCNITSDPVVMGRTRGDMAQYDHRDQVTRFFATATPRVSNEKKLQPIAVTVRIDGVYKLRRGETIHCVGWFRTSANNKTKYAVYVPNKNVVKKIYFSVNSIVERFRVSTRSRVLSGIDRNNHTLASALFFGIRGNGWNDVALQFRKAGMSHILAISGLHVSLIVFLVLKVIQTLHIGTKTSTVLVICSLAAILLLIEARAPAIRAAIMLCVVFGMRVGGLRTPTTSLLGTAAIVMLFIFPKDAGNVGFQLSFVVVTSLCVLLPHIQWRMIGPPDVYRKKGSAARYWIASAWITGLCAWTVSTPITAHVFGTISPSGLITNVPAITLLATSLVAGFFRLCFGWIDILVDYGAQQQLVLFLSTLSNVAKLAGKLPLAHIQGISLSGFWATAVFSWVLWWSVAIRNRWRIWAAVPLLLFAITTSVQVPEDEVVVTTINVGHGTCHIIQQGKYTIMVDGGSKSNLDVGANTILPIGRQIGVTSIDVMVITHSDLDHIAGLVDVLRTIHVSKILLAHQATQHQTPPLSWVLLEAQRLGIQVEMVSRGWQESVGDICLSILSPDKDEKYRSSNAASIVVLLQAHGRAILLTGDIDEQKIVELQNFLDSPIDILELPHHGQWSQESQELLNWLCPPIIIQSTNMSRHTRDKWSIPKKSSRFVTAVDGTLTTTVTQNGTITITGSKHPVSMPLCCVSN